jgi:hypothetical protein
MNALAEIDLTSGEELRRIAVGIDPDGLRWAQQSDGQGRTGTAGVL